MKHKRFLRILFVIALVAALTTTVYAYMFHKSRTVSNVFKPAVVTCQIDEKFENNVKSEITVKNTGNIPAYIRVRLVFHWEDSKGNPVGWNMEHDKTLVSYDTTKWTRVDDYTFYYKDVVAPGDSTSSLLKDDFTLKMEVIEETLEGNKKVRYEYYPVMEVLAEAVQANPEIAEDYAWNKILTANSK